MAIAVRKQKPRRVESLAGTALAVRDWREGEALEPRDLRVRREYLRRTFLRSSRGRAEMQTLGDLLGIPVGTIVVAHLFKGGQGADPDTRRRIAYGLQLGPEDNDAVGIRRLVKVGHVGRAYGPFRWTKEMATSAWQSATRYVFFDAGDDVLHAIDWRRHMSLLSFKTSEGLPAALVRARGFAGKVHFESQTDGFGMVWPTRLSAPVAVGRALPLLPPAGEDDYARVTDVDGGVHDFPAREIEAQLTAHAELLLVRLEIGHCSLVWGRAQSGRRSDYGEMGYGDDSYDRSTVRGLLAKTGDLPSGWRLDQIVDVADATIGSPEPPAV
jgi:hypothetical protein